MLNSGPKGSWWHQLPFGPESPPAATLPAELGPRRPRKMMVGENRQKSDRFGSAGSTARGAWAPQSGLGVLYLHTVLTFTTI